jgi:endonuclease-8
MPEGDTILFAANRMRPVLEGRVPDSIATPQPRHALDRWPERLAGRTVTSVGTHGKHLFIHFDGNLVLHSHLGMVGSWRVYDNARPWSSGRAWIVLTAAGRDVVEFGGPTLELLTEGRARFDQRLAALGPDVLAAEFDSERFLKRLRADDQTRGIGDALLEQTTVAGIGNIWKAEGCWEIGLDPWRPTGGVTDEQALAVIDAIRPRMLRSATEGHRAIMPQVYKHAGRPCPRCGSVITARAGGLGRSPSGLATAGTSPRRPAGDANRTTYWCPGCQR